MKLNYRESIYEDAESADRIEWLVDQGWPLEHAEKLVEEFRGPTEVEITWIVDTDKGYEHKILSVKVDGSYYDGT